MKTKMGRPKIENPRNVLLSFRATIEEAKAIRGAAKKAKKTLSDYIISTLKGQ